MSDELTELPEGWIWTNVKDITSVITGKTPSTSNEAFWDGDIPFVTPSQICPSGSMLPPNRTLTKVGAEQARIIPANSTLAVCIGTVGKIGLLDRPSVINQQLNALVPSQRVSAEFLYYWSQYFLRSWIIENASATVNAAILNKSRLETAPVVLPPLNEQKRIVAKIEELRDRHQRAKQALEAIPELCDRFRQSILAAAFRGDLTADWREQNPDVEPASVLLERIRGDRYSSWCAELDVKGKDSSKIKYQKPIEPEISDLERLPNTWQWVSLDQLLYSLRNGLSRKPADELPGIPILRISAVRSMKVNTSDIRFYRLDISEGVDSYLLETGDLLFTRYNGNQEFVGVCGLVPEMSSKLLYPDKLVRGRLVNKDLCLPEFLEIVCNVGASRAHIEQYIKTSAGQHGIAGSDLKSVPIPLPPTSEQKAIVEAVQSQLSVLQRLNSISSFCSGELQMLDQAILAKAFRGELVDQNLNDEPASVLLDRIRAERKKAQASKRTKGLGRGSKTSKGAAEQMTLPDTE